MPNYRYTEREVRDTVTPIIQAAGGRISHNDLLAALEAQDKGAMLSYVIKDAQAGGAYMGDLVADESGTKPVLHYKLRNAPAAAAPAPNRSANNPVPPKPVQ